MSRPLERLGIDALEAYLARTAVTEDELFGLKEELEIRTTPRAKVLLHDVVKHLSSMQKGQSEKNVRLVSAAASNAQASLPFDVPVFVAAPATAPAKPIRASTPAVTLVHEPQISTNSGLSGTSSGMSVEQALNVLKVPAKASWEQIEKARRELVGRSQPDKLEGLPLEERRALQDECRQVNAAYKILSQVRT